MVGIRFVKIKTGIIFFAVVVLFKIRQRIVVHDAFAHRLRSSLVQIGFGVFQFRSGQVKTEANKFALVQLKRFKKKFRMR